MTDFDKATAIAAIGEDAALSVVESFKHLALSEKEYQQYQTKRLRPEVDTDKTLDFIKIKNNSKISDQRLIKEAKLKTGKKIDLDKIEKGVSKLYQSGYFQSVQYSLLEEDGKTGILLDADAKTWLEQYVRLGFSIEDNLDGDDNFRLAAAYRTTTLQDSYTEYQAEIGKTPQLFVEHYHLLSPSSEYFINPSARVGRADLVVRSDGENIAEYQRESGAGTR